MSFDGGSVCLLSVGVDLFGLACFGVVCLFGLIWFALFCLFCVMFGVGLINVSVCSKSICFVLVVFFSCLVLIWLC